MSEEVPSFSQSDSLQKNQPQEARITQILSEQSVHNLVNNYTNVSRKYQEAAKGEAYSKQRGLLEGRKSALATILENLGQRDVVQKVEGQISTDKPAGHIDLFPITQPDRNMAQNLLADFQRQYMLRLLSADKRPRIRFRDRLAGQAKEINAYFDYASGINEGKYEELSGFLQTIGYGLQMDSIQQQADRLFKRDAQRMRDRVYEQSTRKFEAIIANLHEAAKDLEDSLADLEIPPDEPPEREQQ